MKQLQSPKTLRKEYPHDKRIPRFENGFYVQTIFRTPESQVYYDCLFK